MHAFTNSLSQTQGKTTQSVNVSRIPLKTDFFTGKMIGTTSKRYFSTMVPQLDGGVSLTFLVKDRRRDMYKRQKVLQNSLKNKRLSVTEKTNASKCTAQKNSIFAFAFDNITYQGCSAATGTKGYSP